jgi:hypothetical protein
MSIPKAGDIAFCGRDALGLILKDGLQEVTYEDGSQGQSYVGIHLTDDIASAGSFWCSRNPKVVGRVERIGDEFEIRLFDVVDLWGSAIDHAIRVNLVD